MRTMNRSELRPEFVLPLTTDRNAVKIAVGPLLGYTVAETFGVVPSSVDDSCVYARLFAASPDLFRELNDILETLIQGNVVRIEPFSMKAESIATAIAKVKTEAKSPNAAHEAPE